MQVDAWVCLGIAVAATQGAPAACWARMRKHAAGMRTRPSEAGGKPFQRPGQSARAGCRPRPRATRAKVGKEGRVITDISTSFESLEIQISMKEIALRARGTHPKRADLRSMWTKIWRETAGWLSSYRRPKGRAALS